MKKLERSGGGWRTSLKDVLPKQQKHQKQNPFLAHPKWEFSNPQHMKPELQEQIPIEVSEEMFLRFYCYCMFMAGYSLSCSVLLKAAN